MFSLRNIHLIFLTFVCFFTGASYASPGLQVESSGTPGIRLVEPTPGATLTVGGPIQVLIWGISPNDLPLAHVVFSARPQGASGDGTPLFRCNNQAWVQLRPDASCGMGWLYDPASRAGTLTISWNAATQLRGSYTIRAELFRKHPNGTWGLLARTDWAPVKLVDSAPLQAPVIRAPEEGAVFVLGQDIPIEIDLGRTALFNYLRVEISEIARAQGSVQPVVLWEGVATGTTYRTTWTTARPLPNGQPITDGQYELAAVGITEGGLTVRTYPRKIVLVPKRPLRILMDGGELTAGSSGPVTQGRTVQFCADDSPVGGFKSFLWNFGDGGQATEKCTAYIFRNPGTYDLTLRAFTEPGHQGIEVILAARVVVQGLEPKVRVTREVLGFPDPCAGRMTLLVGHGAYARLTLEIGTDAVAVSAYEALPRTWQLLDETDRTQADVAILPVIAEPSDDTVTFTWVIAPPHGLDRIPTGTRLEITYFLIPPTQISKGRTEETIDLRGVLTVTTRDGEVFEYPIDSGQTSLTLVDRVDIPVLIAHLEGGTIQPRTFATPFSERYIITTEQFEEAVRLLGQDVVLPGHRLTTKEMERVIFYYKGRLPVTECLPRASK